VIPATGVATYTLTQRDRRQREKEKGEKSKERGGAPIMNSSARGRERKKSHVDRDDVREKK
jgi:hypothetical protein